MTSLAGKLCYEPTTVCDEHSEREHKVRGPTNPSTGRPLYFFYLDTDGCLSEVLEIQKSSQVQDGSDLLCGRPPMGDQPEIWRATIPRTGRHPSTGRPLYFFPEQRR